MLMKKPKTNTILVKPDMKVKMLLFSIKNHLMHYKEVHLEAVGRAIGKALSASKLLEEEKVGTIEKLNTDLIGEERKYSPKVLVTLAKVRKLN